MQGEPEVVMDYYNALLADSQSQNIKQETTKDGKVQTVSGTGEAQIASATIINSNGESVEVIDVGQTVTLVITVQANTALPELVLGYLIKDRLGQHVYGTNTHLLGAPINKIKLGERVKYQFTFPANIGEGSYSVSLALHASESHQTANYVWKDRAIIFSVINISRQHFAGVAWLQPEWKFQRE
jgi:lipopolysaccharide transport system ATP-binding protein